MSVSWFNAYFGQGQNTAVANNATNNFEVTLPLDTLGGNAIGLFMSWNSTTATVSTIKDTINGTWNLANTLQKSIIGLNNTDSFYALANSGAGTTTITITFSAVVQPPVVEVFEIPGVATIQGSLSGGAVATADVAGASLTTGSFTPIANNANGGNIIFGFFHNSNGFQSGQAPSSFVAGGSFNLMRADISEKSATTPAGNPKATAFFVQATSASINPAMTATGDTDTFNCMACALQLSPGAGKQPSGLYIVSATASFLATMVTTWKLQMPCYGNARVWTNDSGAQFTGLVDTDNGGGGYTFIAGDAGTPTGGVDPQIFWVHGQTQDTSNVLTVTGNASQVTAGIKGQGLFFDLAGVGPAIGANAHADSTPADVQTHVPDITPTQIGSLIINIGVIGNGPVPVPIISPSNARFVGLKYWNQGDSDPETIGDLWAICPTTSLAAQAWSCRGGMVFVNAASSWTTGTTITLAQTITGISTGAVVFDQTTGQQIGTVSTISGTTLTLQAGASHPSSGTSDQLDVESINGGSGGSFHAVEFLQLSGAPYNRYINQPQLASILAQ